MNMKSAISGTRTDQWIHGVGEEEEENPHLKATPDMGDDADRIVEI